MGSLRIVLAQLNLLVGDVAGNAQKMIAAARRARAELEAELVVFPELALTSYPPEDLLLRPDLTERVETSLGEMMQALSDMDVIVGYPKRQYGKLFNAASLLRGGRVAATYYKRCLPNYSVFDEMRYFAEGREPCVVDIKGVPVGLTVCEDVWEGWPVDEAAKAGAKLVININASPFHLNKGKQRFDVVARAARANRVPIVYLNLIGGQDELVFDGDSFVVDAQGAVTHRARAFEEELIAVEVSIPGAAPAPGAIAAELSEEKSAYSAIVLGVRDYIEKNRFRGVVLGLSGGIDSALTLCIAVDAIGAERVHTVMMPSRYTAAMSHEDARAQAQALGVQYSVIPIEPMFEAFLEALKDEFRGLKPDTTEENLQARIRGMLLMAISNKTGRIVLTTGNKSEMAVGYATLYGDMAGGFAAIKDVPKTLVYRLAEYRNRIAPVIPRRVLERPPSAELRPDQKDTDSLPPYPVLDPILERYVEGDESIERIVAAGFDPETVRRVVAMVDRNEYKRRQAPPGVRITPRAFGRDRRYPITSGYGGGGKGL
ncbi:MAG: NAD+ synthase [Candidatus Muproteobacteria bacterium RBG_16_65_34]|uniref:Glutamine-dependent NAD(+) synthetase n=1 Tax=Candidatus Muproteobacteria bacterium RBG_16_65_34 TaxID=1817760 RepID=A0A1F6TTY7_9PROT|nr:MAG: NAD+ synthase [Candidatus Muproteobacteria bacterium RBG_16_65_34]